MHSKYFLISIVFFFCVFFSYAQTIEISGQVSGKVAESLKEVHILVDGKIKKIPIDANSLTFKGEIPITESQFITVITAPNVNNYIYVIPTENININILKDATLAPAQITINNGNCARVNKVMDAFYNTINANSTYKTTEADWAKELFGKVHIVKQAIEKASTELDKDKKFIQKVAPNFIKDFDFFTYVFNHYIALDDYSLNEIENILSNISKQEIKTNALSIPYLQEFMNDITNAYAALKLKNYGLTLDRQERGYISDMIASEACVRFIPNQDIINVLFLQKINTAINLGAKNKAYIDYLFANTTSNLADKFLETYKDINSKSSEIKPDERVKAFNFELKDLEGNVVTLEDFKGKLLYIDFWASWCGPCKMQMPYLREIEKLYEGKNIVFASVSLDATKEAWIKGVESENLHGVVLHAEGDFKNPFPTAYQIKAIPRFMLIDSEGNVISDNAPRPQNSKELIDLIDADLYKGELDEIVNNHFKAVGVEHLKNGMGLRIKTRQSTMGIEIDQIKHYQFPKNFRYDAKPIENASRAVFETLIGSSFYQDRFMVIKDQEVFGDIKQIRNSSENWIDQLKGIDLFLLKVVENQALDLAPEHKNNDENCHVVQCTQENQISKFYIDKDTHLIKKVVTIHTANNRSGGGTMTSSNSYSDYKNIDGMMLPFSINVNNITNHNIEEVQLLKIGDGVFVNKAINNL